jgi:1-acyl-sn-glycerol-3-phosphate acyltransferase
VTGSDAVPVPPSRGELIVYRICRFIAVGVSRLYFPGTVTGRENLPATGAFIVAPVHRSYVDWLLVARITNKRRLRYIVKEEVWKSKLIGRLLLACGAFPVNRSGADREALQRCQAVLAGGEPLVMFPEGTRRSGPEVTQLKDGVVYLALRAGVPVVPVGIGGSERAMPRGSSFPRPRRVNVVIGPPVPARSPADASGRDESSEPADPAISRKRARVTREATTEQSLRVRAAIQQAFDAAEASLRR